MPRKPKAERNAAIVEKHQQGKSFRELARFFNLQTSTVHEIYHRDKEKYGKKERSGYPQKRRLQGVRD